ncbi:Glutamate-gated chloride channel [Aphelenchoides besseyi]|nr:Glutamate-gated chloride channel [Aphelenchoides besseyi]KAI6211922.1 Glutamate-gated chloride channel [Aphelenchoides besseyi]
MINGDWKFVFFFLAIEVISTVALYSFYHTAESRNGSAFSFLNLKIKFQSNDVVSGEEDELVESEGDDFYDIDFDSKVNEWDRNVATSSSIRFQIPTTFKPFASTTTMKSQDNPMDIKAWLSNTKARDSEYSVKAWISRHKSKGLEDVEYPMNDEEPSLKELLQIVPLVVPHRLRHSGRKSKGRISELERRKFIEDNGLQDDEDYVEDEWISSTVETEKITESTTTSISVDDEEKLNSSTSLNTTATKVRLSHEMSPEDERIFAFFGLFFDDEEEEYVDTANETSDQFVLTAQEILHSDPLGREEEKLRELLTNVSNLEIEVENAHRDHGASFILPVLKAIEYDNNSVPVVFPDIPVNVRVALNVIYLGNFDSIDMEYSIDLEMHMSWFDVRLANNYTKPIRIREKEILESIWRPDPYFVNSKFSYFHIVSFPNMRMRVMPTGLVHYTLRVTLLPICLMTFCRFPHDDQNCDLKISSIAYPRSFVNFTWHSDPVHYNSRVSLPELRVIRLFTEGCRVEGKLVSSSCLRLGIQLERDGARYIAEKYIPSCLAMMFAWVAFYVPYHYEDVRIITPITVLLTLVQMEKGDSKIHTSYLTSMDIWFVAMKTFTVMSLVESLAVLALIKRSRGVKKQQNRAPNEYEKEKLKVQRRRLTQLYHQMDTISRFLQPMIFIMFLLYYVIHLTQRDEMNCIGKSIFDITH